jgi:lon-related putative ATP-dependent protease
MAKTTHPLQLDTTQLARQCDVNQFKFETTADLPGIREIIGQPRGVRAIEFGIDMASDGYNIYVMGDRGTGRLTAIERFIQARASDDPTPDDFLYVHNFNSPHQPVAIRLEAGKGRALRDAMEELIERLTAEMTRTFESQAFTESAQVMKREFQEKRDSIFQQVQAMAAENDFSIRSTSSGMVLAPIRNGQIMSAEAYEALPAEERAEVEENRHEVEHKLAEAMREAAELEELAKESYTRLQRDTAAAVLDGYIVPIKNTYTDYPDVMEYLNAVQQDIVKNFEDFIAEDGGPQGSEDGRVPVEMAAEGAGDIAGLQRYSVNLLVDHQESKGAPVVVVDLPTYQNLIGRIEHQVQFGALTTDFTMIKPGALHQANGGFLVIRALDILQQPFAWEALKRALNTGEICVEEPESRGTGVITTQMLEPAPIPLRVKVIMLGNPLLYYALFESEEDFPELFKVKADFAAVMERNTDTETQYAAFVATRCHEDKLPHFTAAAVGRMIDYSAWLAGDQTKLSTRFGEITDLIREAAYYARRDKRDVTTDKDVSLAISERRYRSNLYEELSDKRILDGDVIIDTDGEAVGQINGLTILQLGDYSFGQPSRITARVYVGQTDVVQIEREVEMTGPIHDKGVLILRGYLGSTYAQDFPLTMAASLTFEQNYGGVEGDSASSTELYALMSALSGYAIRQDLAVTGSVDQRGIVQPIGGATQKVEGFFRICQQRGLTGKQGVLIPKINVHNLMLNDQVREAVRKKKFHVYAIETIEQGIELLTGIPAGERQPDGTYPEGTVHHAVQNRLRALAQGLRSYVSPIVNIERGA